MKKIDCLIVDDEPDIRELLEITLSRMQISTRSAGTLAAARELLESESFRLCLSDMRLPDGDGIELVEHISRTHPQLPVAMITAHGNMMTAVKALKAGAFDFVSKPVDLKVLRNLVETALKLSADKTTTAAAAGNPGDGNIPELFGHSAEIEAIRQMTRKLARSQAPVHISGESGTGKELAARMIHGLSPRSDRPFVAINCGAVPEELMESEFFGHIKGSFTGAVADKQGLFQAADRGTLFLDEVADLPVSMQVKLLRAIQEKSVRPVGGTGETPVDVRLISATHKNLQELVRSGHFRQDLFYRINVIELSLPALREHREDLPALIDHILEKLCNRNQLVKPGISEAALEQLLAYDFPGNVRELENILEGALALHENARIIERDLKINRQQAKHVAQPLLQEGSLEQQLERFESSLIEQALSKHQWNRTAAAAELGLSLRQLRYKMEKFALDRSE